MFKTILLSGLFFAMYFVKHKRCWFKIVLSASEYIDVAVISLSVTGITVLIP